MKKESIIKSNKLESTNSITFNDFFLKVLTRIYNLKKINPKINTYSYNDEVKLKDIKSIRSFDSQIGQVRNFIVDYVYKGFKFTATFQAEYLKSYRQDKLLNLVSTFITKNKVENIISIDLTNKSEKFLFTICNKNVTLANALLNLGEKEIEQILSKKTYKSICKEFKNLTKLSIEEYNNSLSNSVRGKFIPLPTNMNTELDIVSFTNFFAFPVMYNQQVDLFANSLKEKIYDLKISSIDYFYGSKEKTHLSYTLKGNVNTKVSIREDFDIFYMRNAEDDLWSLLIELLLVISNDQSKNKTGFKFEKGYTFNYIINLLLNMLQTSQTEVKILIETINELFKDTNSYGIDSFNIKTTIKRSKYTSVEFPVEIKHKNKKELMEILVKTINDIISNLKKIKRYEK